MNRKLVHTLAGSTTLLLALACAGVGSGSDDIDDFRCDSRRQNLLGWPEGLELPTVVVSDEVKVKGRTFPCDDKAKPKCKLAPGTYHPNGGPGEYQFIGQGPAYKATREVTLKGFNDGPGPTLAAGDTLELLVRGPAICIMRDGRRNTHEVQCPGSFDDGLALQTPSGPDPILMFKPDCDVWLEVNDDLFALDEVSRGEARSTTP